MKSAFLATAITLGLALPAHAATATTAAWSISLPANLKDALIADLTNAEADAKAHNDTRHGPCWTALISFANSDFANPLPNKPGIFLLVQKGFDFAGAAGTPLVPTEVAQACGPVVLDLKMSFATLLAKVGFVVAPIKLPF